MCNKRSERDLQTDNREYQNMNVGLVNMSKTGDGIDSSDIIICIIAAICVMMLIKWLKKCYNRRQERMIRQLQAAQPIQMQVQPPAQPMQFQQLHVPALAPPIAEPAYRVHYRPATSFYLRRPTSHGRLNEKNTGPN